MDLQSDVRWYYRVAGQEYGPVPTHELIALVRQRKLFPDDLIKLEKDGEWFFAGNVEDLFSTDQESTALPARQPYDSRSNRSSGTLSSKSGKAGVRTPPARAGAAATAASDVLDHIHDRQFDAENEPQPSDAMARIAGGATSMWDAGAEQMTSVRDFVFGKLSLLRVVFGPKMALVVLCAVALAAILRFVPIDWFTAPDAEATYVKLWTELKQLRQSKANDIAWAEFSARASEELTPIVKRLERQAKATDQRSLALLWAGRDYLPRMLHDARKEVSESEKKFEAQLATAQRVMDEDRSETSNSDSGTLAILFIDGCIVLAFLTFILIKRR